MQPSYETSPPPSTQIQEQATPPPLARAREPARKWRDIFWLGLFILHMIGLGLVLVILGLNRFRKPDRLKLNRFTNRSYGILKPSEYHTENFWPVYAVAAVLGALLAWACLMLLCLRPDTTIKVAVHSLTTYLAVISVFCFRDGQFFFGIAFAIGAVLQFVYTMSVMDRMPFTTLVLRKAVKLVMSVPAATRISYVFIALFLLWLALWSFGVSGVVASGMDDSGRWWLILVLCVSLFWTGAVISNTIHVIVAGVVVLALADEQIVPPSLLRSLRYAVTTSLGSICYGSLFTAAIRTMRWAIRGLRSRIGKNECLLCCVDFLFHLVETLVRFFNKYAYVEVATFGKSFNHSARDAWELFQSTGIEVLIAYDLSGAILLMEVALGGLVTGTCAGIWTWFKWKERVLVIGVTAMLIGMILVGLGLVVVESAVTSLYLCYATDPSLISRWDPEFAEQIAETLHQRLQHRSGREVPPFGVQLPKTQSNLSRL